MRYAGRSGVDKVLNLHEIALPDESVGTVITCDTLEHVEHPHKALSEIHRILKPGGIVLLSTVLDFRIHDSPADYWRFTPDGLRSLLKPFSFVFVGTAGRESFPHTVIAIGAKSSILPTLLLSYFFQDSKTGKMPEKSKREIMEGYRISIYTANPSRSRQKDCETFQKSLIS